MFFVSEEFLRKYEQGEEFSQTIDSSVPVGKELFEDSGSKKEHNIRERKRSEGE